MSTVLVLSVPAFGQQRASGASVRISVDHWANAYIARLRDRGYLTGLNPLVQPWRAADIAAELAQLDPDTLPRPARDWVQLLQQEFGWRATDVAKAPVRGGGAAYAGLRTSTSQRLDPSRPLGEDGVWPRYQVGGWFETGPVSAQLRLLGDTYFNDDPDGLDPGQRRGARSDFAYLAFDVPAVSVEVGRLARNWSRSGDAGLMISDGATPYPQLGIEVRAWRLVLRGFTGELESLDGRKRYLSAHRLDYESRNFVASFGESIVYAEQSGGLRLRFLNPVEFLFFDADNQPEDATQNLMLDIQVWTRVGNVTMQGEGLLDDLDVSPAEGVQRAPARYALWVRGQWVPPRSALEVSVGYTQVSSYAYRTSRYVDRYTYLERGIGENYADFDRLRLAVEYSPPVHGLIVAGQGVVLRQGEGDFRQPFGDYDEFRASPALFLGTREDTYRLGLAGRYQPVRFAWLGWDVGYNWIRNRNHVQDSSENLFSAVAEVGVRVDFPFRSNR